MDNLAKDPAIRVLLIDDSADLLFIMKTELEILGYDVKAVGDGKRALEAAAQSTPDVVISDLQMPEMDGIEFVERLRRDLHSVVPVIAITGFEVDHDVELCQIGGFAAHLTKPVEPELLSELIQRLVRESTSK